MAIPYSSSDPYNRLGSAVHEFYHVVQLTRCLETCVLAALAGAGGGAGAGSGAGGTRTRADPPAPPRFSLKKGNDEQRTFVWLREVRGHSSAVELCGRHIAISPVI